VGRRRHSPPNKQAMETPVQLAQRKVRVCPRPRLMTVCKRTRRYGCPVASTTLANGRFADMLAP